MTADSVLLKVYLCLVSSPPQMFLIVAAVVEQNKF